MNGGSTRNVIGVKFFQDAELLLIADFNKKSTRGGLISNDRRIAGVVGKTLHCFCQHGLDLSKSTKPCPVCGQSSDTKTKRVG